MRALSQALGTGLDDRALLALVQLCELGVHPEALAQVVVLVRDAPCSPAPARTLAAAPRVPPRAPQF